MRRILVAAVSAVVLLSTGLDGASAGGTGARLDDSLVLALSDAKAADKLRVFVHAADLDGIETAEKAANTAGLRILHYFTEVGVVAAEGTPKQIRAAGRISGISYLESDRELGYATETSHIATRGKEALEGFSVTGDVPKVRPDGKPHKRKKVTTTYNSAPVDGAGVGIAVIDSGVDGTHPMFDLPEGASSPTGSRVVRNLKHLNACPVRFVQEELPLPCSMNPTTEVFVDVPTNDSDTPSAGGHGTHVAGIAAGGKFTLPDGGVIQGAAPASRVVALSVGASLSVYGGTQGFQWVYANHRAPCGAGVPADQCPPITVINNSYGPLRGPFDFDPENVTVKYQRLLVEQGVVVVWAAGNAGGNGTADMTNPPGKDPTGGVLMVANYDDNDSGTRNGSLAPSSSRGNRIDPTTWPDVSAPGTDITSTCRVTLSICSSGEGDVGTISGTSMAAPHIAGIVAQLQQAGIQDDPAGTAALKPAAIEDAIEDTAHPYTFGSPYFTDWRNTDHASSYDKGHGLVDVVGAVSRLRGFPVGGTNTDAPAVTCAAPLVADGTGDASHVSTDLTAMTIDGNAASGVTFKISVKDLTAEYPKQSNGVFFDANFVAGGAPFYVGAARSMFRGVLPLDPATTPQIEGTRFSLGRRNGNILETYANLAGTFDLETNTITILLTAADVEEANTAIDRANARPGATPVPRFPALVDGLKLGGVVLNSNRSIDGVVVSGFSADDTSAATCDAVVGGPAVPPPPPPAPPTTSPPSSDVDATLATGETFEADGVIEDEQIEYTCTGPEDPICPTYALQLNPSGATGTLTIFVTTTDNPILEDYDLALYDSAGKKVGGVGNPGTLIEETAVEDLEAGVYRLVVNPYLVSAGSTFHVEASLS